jgi:hypothetical protein
MATRSVAKKRLAKKKEKKIGSEASSNSKENGRERAKTAKMCGVCFVPTANLNYLDHFKKAHPGVRFKKALTVEPLACHLCDYKTRVKTGLEQHLGLKHGVGPRAQFYRFECTECGEVFRQADCLKVCAINICFSQPRYP